MQILTEAEAEAEEFWQKKMLKKGHCLGKAHCIYSDNTVYYTVYICPDEFVAPNKEDCPPPF